MDIEHLAQKLQKNDRVIGLDPGKKTIGVALASLALGVATPLETIIRKKYSVDILRLQALIKEYEIRAIIIGLPLNMDGSEGRRTQSVRDFATALIRDIPNVEIAFWDERLSTHHMESFLIEQADVSRRRRDEVIDKLAAQHILQGAVDYLQQHI